MHDRSVAIVGRGRLGTALARAFRAVGLSVVGPLGRGSNGGQAPVLLLCVPDAAIPEAARTIPPGRLVGHCSGLSTLESLAPHEAFSLHPLMTVTGDTESFAGAGCAVAGSTSRALEEARELARMLGMQPFEIADEDRPLYHAAASLASNYLVTLEGAAERLATMVGLERDRLAPLVRAAVENWARAGARAALTGPIVRGDEATLQKQRAAVATRASDLIPLWDALTDATRALAHGGGVS
jgi:predicted short-subunit dehydrogenase-like oxidoreductase (DUF2520 family)